MDWFLILIALVVHFGLLGLTAAHFGADGRGFGPRGGDPDDRC